jgi:hypothetical protein
MNKSWHGMRVRLTRPSAEEVKAHYIVVEDNGDRLLIRLICDLPFPPIELVSRNDVVLIEELGQSQNNVIN